MQHASRLKEALAHIKRTPLSFSLTIAIDIAFIIIITLSQRFLFAETALNPDALPPNLIAYVLSFYAGSLVLYSIAKYTILLIIRQTHAKSAFGFIPLLRFTALNALLFFMIIGVFIVAGPASQLFSGPAAAFFTGLLIYLILAASYMLINIVHFNYSFEKVIPSARKLIPHAARRIVAYLGPLYLMASFFIFYFLAAFLMPFPAAEYVLMSLSVIAISFNRYYFHAISRHDPYHVHSHH